MITKSGLYHEPTQPCVWCGHYDTSHTEIRRPSEFVECKVPGCPCGGFERRPTFAEVRRLEKAGRRAKVYRIAA